MSEPPAVSIAIRAYRRRWLGEAIESVLAQTRDDLELVVYDDAGDLEPAVSSFDDPRVRYHRPQEKRATTSGRFQAALSLCRGRHLGVLDDDDRYEPRFVERLLGALEAEPRAGVAFCRVVYEVDGHRYEPPDPRPAGRQPNALREIVAYRSVVWPSAMLVRREAYEAAERHRPMVDGVAPDAFLNVHTAAAGWGHVHVDVPLAVRRWHGEQRSEGGLATIGETVETWRRLSVGDCEVDALRRSVLVRKLLWLAAYRLEAGETPAARAALAEARAADSRAWRLPRALLVAAARVPVLGRATAWAVLTADRARRRRYGPPGPARGARGWERAGR